MNRKTETNTRLSMDAFNRVLMLLNNSRSDVDGGRVFIVLIAVFSFFYQSLYYWMHISIQYNGMQFVRFRFNAFPNDHTNDSIINNVSARVCECIIMSTRITLICARVYVCVICNFHIEMLFALTEPEHGMEICINLFFLTRFNEFSVEWTEMSEHLFNQKSGAHLPMNRETGVSVGFGNCPKTLIENVRFYFTYLCKCMK